MTDRIEDFAPTDESRVLAADKHESMPSLDKRLHAMKYDVYHIA